MNIKERQRRFSIIEPAKEIQLQKMVTTYLQLYYKGISFRNDLAGNNISKAQSGIAKSINERKGWPDFEIFVPRLGFGGLHIEFKKEGTNLIQRKDAKKAKVAYYKRKNEVSLVKQGKRFIRKKSAVKIPVYENKVRKSGDWISNHIEDQAICHEILTEANRKVGFSIGLLNALKIIDGYLLEDEEMMNEGFFKKPQLVEF